MAELELGLLQAAVVLRVRLRLLVVLEILRCETIPGQRGANGANPVPKESLTGDTPALLFLAAYDLRSLSSDRLRLAGRARSGSAVESGWLAECEDEQVLSVELGARCRPDGRGSLGPATAFWLG